MTNQYDCTLFTNEEQQFIRDNYNKLSYIKMAEHLSTNKDRIAGWCYRHRSELGPKNRCQEKHYKYPKEVIEYLKNNINIYPTYNDLTIALNKQFGTNYKMINIREMCHKRLGLRKENNMGSFQKGNRRTKYNIGDEVIKKGTDHKDYIWVKIADVPYNYSKSWKQKQQVVWEKYNGPIPKGMFVIFLDQNTMNCDISNLALIDRKTHVRMNKQRWYSENQEFTKTGLAYCKLIVALYDNK